MIGIPAFQFIQTIGQFAVAFSQLAKPDKGAHHQQADCDGAPGREDIGDLQGTEFGESPGKVAAAASGT